MSSKILSYVAWYILKSHAHGNPQAGYFENMQAYCGTTLKYVCLSARSHVMWNKLNNDLNNSTNVNVLKKGINPFWLVSMQ